MIRKRAGALFLVLALVAPATVRAQSRVAGRVLGPAGVTAVPGARVLFFNLLTRMLERSEPADEQGNYAIGGLRPGRYDVGVETSRGLWLVEREVKLEESGERRISFALRESPYWEGADEVPPGSSTLGENIVGTAVVLESDGQPAAAIRGAGRKVWIGVGAGASVLGLALAAGDGDGEASPFRP